MFSEKPKESEQISWILVIFWIASIVAAIPVARKLQGLVENWFGRTFFLVFVAIYLSILLCLALTQLYGRREIKPGLNGLLLILSALTFGFWAWTLRDNPERTLHFVQYGTLSLLVYRALCHRWRDKSVYFLSLLFCSLTGTIDEIIQWSTPQRFFDFEDIAINAGSAALIQFSIALAIKPALISRPLSQKGTAVASNLAMLQAFLLFLCLCNTPQLVHWYATKIPSLSFLANNESIMAEYGYRHHVPNLGTFYSRLTLDELLRQDQERGDEAAKIISRFSDSNRYTEFLRTFGPGVDPLVHEARVRIFRRDTHWALSHNYKPEEAKFQDSITIAWKEHLILLQFFPNTYTNSTMMLQPSDASYLYNNASKEVDYLSPVSAELITSFSQVQMLGIILFTFCFLLAAKRILVCKVAEEDRPKE